MKKRTFSDRGTKKGLWYVFFHSCKKHRTFFFLMKKKISAPFMRKEPKIFYIAKNEKKVYLDHSVKNIF